MEHVEESFQHIYWTIIFRVYVPRKLHMSMVKSNKKPSPYRPPMNLEPTLSAIFFEQSVASLSTSSNFEPAFDTYIYIYYIYVPEWL